MIVSPFRLPALAAPRQCKTGRVVNLAEFLHTMPCTTLLKTPAAIDL
jgi:hypothetical protein